jgi:hypothetical protein
MDNLRLSLDDFLNLEEKKRFEEDWQKFKGKDKPASPSEVHMSFPVISEVLRFEDKMVYRARVLQSERRLRKVNPYFNANRYLMPFWHPVHYLMAGEQFYHACMEQTRPDNCKYFVREIPMFDLRRPIYWPSRTNGHVSAIGIIKMLKGSWESGNAREQFSVDFVDDVTGTLYGGGYGLCFVNFRSFYKSVQGIKKGVPEAREKLIRQIEEQAALHEKLLIPRKTLLSTKDKLIEALNKQELPEEEITDFFNFYDRGTEVNDTRCFSIVGLS